MKITRVAEVFQDSLDRKYERDLQGNWKSRRNTDLLPSFVKELEAAYKRLVDTERRQQ